MDFLRKNRRVAFDKAVAHYEAALLRYASRLLNSDDSAQDVVQNAFIKLYRRWREPFEPSSSLSSWLYRVVHNEAVDHVRKETRRRQLHQNQAEEVPCSTHPDCGFDLNISEQAAHAADALQTLSERDRQVVILKVYEELSYKEISTVTGLSVGNIGFILHHAMKKLAAEMQRTGDA